MQFSEHGSGPAVLMLHSVPGTTGSFGPLARALSSRARALVPAMPGYGASPRLEPYTHEGVRERIELELEARGVRSCAIVAHSGGTYRALCLALAGRIRVEAMVLVGAVAGFDEASRAQYEQLSVAVRGGADLRPMYRETATAPGFAARHPERMDEILSAVDACPPAVLADEFHAFAVGEDLRPRLGAIEARTLLLVGEHDRITPAAWSEEIAARMPAARLQTLAGCGHCSLQEDEDGAIKAVFLAAAGYEGAPRP